MSHSYMSLTCRQAPLYDTLHDRLKMTAVPWSNLPDPTGFKSVAHMIILQNQAPATVPPAAEPEAGAARLSHLVGCIGFALQTIG